MYADTNKVVDGVVFEKRKDAEKFRKDISKEISKKLKKELRAFHNYEFKDESQIGYSLKALAE